MLNWLVNKGRTRDEILKLICAECMNRVSLKRWTLRVKQIDAYGSAIINMKMSVKSDRLLPDSLRIFNFSLLLDWRYRNSQNELMLLRPWFTYLFISIINYLAINLLPFFFLVWHQLTYLATKSTYMVNSCGYYYYFLDLSFVQIIKRVIIYKGR